MRVGVPKESRTTNTRRMSRAGSANCRTRPRGVRRVRRRRGDRPRRRGLCRRRSDAGERVPTRSIGMPTDRQGQGAAARRLPAPAPGQVCSPTAPGADPADGMLLASVVPAIATNGQRGLADAPADADEESPVVWRPGRAACLEKSRGGSGVLLGGVPASRRGVSCSGGTVGSNAHRPRSASAPRSSHRPFRRSPAPARRTLRNRIRNPAVDA
jgi:hypothetical protein